MKHLVLGSSGQIGEYLVDHIETIGDEAIRWDRVDGPQYDLIDPRNSDRLQAAMSRADFVHFLAFDVGGSQYLKKHQNSVGYISDNIRLMENTFSALRLTGKPFIFASSQMSNMFDSNYGRLKAIGESYTKALGGLNVRFWNVYGYESDPDKTHVITDFIKMALDYGQILMRTDGEEERIFMHATNAADLLYRISLRYNELQHEMNNEIDYYHRDGSLSGVDALEVTGTRGEPILEIAKIVASQIPGTVIYRGLEKDQTQTIKNEPDLYRIHRLHEILQFSRHNTIKIVDGIADMIKRIENERTI